MKHLVLARKWRPRTFDEVMGQQHVLQALVNSLDMGRLHHAYLFSGTRGVGKTTIARILAKSINCENGVSSKPCGQCQSCLEIDQGRFVDLLEIDAASRTRVEDTRELLDNVQYMPTRGRFKVYLIDEVHMLSRHSFNALLKTLEEPPAHVKFLLATTDPQKLPTTILSRCLQFNLKPLQPSELESQLSQVLSKEGVDVEPQALKILAKSANGSVRDALSLTEQALAFGQGEITSQGINSMLGALDESKVAQLLAFIVNAQANEVMQWVDEACSWGADFSGIIKQLLALLHSIARAQLLAQPLEPASAQLANQLDPQQIQLYYQILSQAHKDLPYAADQRTGFEMALLRLLSFSPEPAIAKPVPILTTQVPRQIVHSNIEQSEDLAVSSAVPDSAESELVQAEAELNQVMLQAELQTGNVQSFAEDFEIAEVKVEESSSEQTLSKVVAPELIEQADVRPEQNAEPAPDIAQQLNPQSEPVVSAAKASQQSNNSELQGLLASHHQLRSHRLNKSGQAITEQRQVSEAQRAPTIKKIEPASESIREPEAVTIQNELVSEHGQRAEQAVINPVSTLDDNEQFNRTSSAYVNELASIDAVFNDAKQWQILIDSLEFTPILRQLLLNSSICKKADEIHIIVKPALQQLLEPAVISELNARLQSYFTGVIKVYSSPDAVGETPIERQRRRHQEKRQEAEQKLRNDPNVIWMMENYGASLVQDSVQYI